MSAGGPKAPEAAARQERGQPTADWGGKPLSRRRFIGYLIAGPTLIAGVGTLAGPAQALPTVQLVDTFDLTDVLTDATLPTADLIQVIVNRDDTVSFAMPRAEVGQGITTACAMVIADEMGIALDRVDVTLADANPKLLFNQFTGGSNSMHSLYKPLRTVAAAARDRLTHTAADQLGVSASSLTVNGGVITAPDGRSVSFGQLAERAAVAKTRAVRPKLKPASDLKIVGTPQRRIEAVDIVTARKQFTMDLDIPDALPTMLCRPPTINGSAASVRNLQQVKAMPGVTDVVVIPHGQYAPGGVAVRARTFGQCIDAVRALDVAWTEGTVGTASAANVLADLRKAEVPMGLALGKTLEQSFVFNFRPGDPLETNCAIADVRTDRAEVWSSLKSPILAAQDIATATQLPLSAVTVHVTQGGGSFGRHLFSDAATEAAMVSKAMGKPVKLMWHRTDSFRQGRVHPMNIDRVRITYSGKNVLAFDQRHTSVATDFTHGFAEHMSAELARVPGLNSLGYSQAVFTLTQKVPYNFGPATLLLGEIYKYGTFNTSSVRNIYSPDVRTASELMVDQLGRALGLDPYQVRRTFIRDSRMLAVLDKLARAGNWGRAMPAGTAQGIAIHDEYKGRVGALVEIDCRPTTVNRRIRDAFTGPRVTRVVMVVDVGLPLNPLGLQAQMMGGAMDGIAQALTYGLHLQDGNFLEGSWDNAYYTRQWNTPPKLQVIVLPPTTGDPGGAGEFGVAASMAATACAYARATGKLPTEFPINFHEPLGFKPLPTVPPIPESPSEPPKSIY